MGWDSRKISPFFISVTAVLTVTVAIILCVFSLDSKINFKSEFYFVCYSVEDNSLSADAISGSVSNYGGAGYILEYNGEYYVTVACYYSEADAERVRQSLLRRGLSCSSLKIETDEYSLRSIAARGNEGLFIGNLNTLLSLSKMCYECANALDRGDYSQAAAKAVLADIESGLNGLKKANTENCFSAELKRLIAACDAASDGYIYSKNMRNLQIAIADTIININLY